MSDPKQHPEREKSPLLPALKAYDWAYADKAICRKLVTGMDVPYMPYLAFGYDHPNTFEFLMREEGVELDLQQINVLEGAAVRHLRERPVNWQEERVRLGFLRRLKMLVCQDDFLTSERIVDTKFMQEAQNRLKTDLLAVGIPARSMLLVTDGRQNKQTLAAFANLVSLQYHQAEWMPITPMTFALHDGKIVGVLQGAEDAGREMVEQEGDDAESDVFVRALGAKDKSTGEDVVYIFFGGSDFARLKRDLSAAFMQLHSELASNDSFSGVFRLVALAHMTPQEPDFREDVESIAQHLQTLADELSTQYNQPQSHVELQWLNQESDLDSLLSDKPTNDA